MSMVIPGSFVVDSRSLAVWKARLQRCIVQGAELPGQVFQREFSYYAFGEFDCAISRGFASELSALCLRSGDNSCLIAVLSPDESAEYRERFGYFNWAEVGVPELAEEYFATIEFCPLGSVVDSIQMSAETVVWTSASGKWAIWGDRESEIVILASDEPPQRASWRDLEWALHDALPYRFPGRVVPAEFEVQFRKNYSDRGGE